MEEGSTAPGLLSSPELECQMVEASTGDRVCCLEHGEDLASCCEGMCEAPWHLNAAGVGSAGCSGDPPVEEIMVTGAFWERTGAIGEICRLCPRSLLYTQISTVI